MVRPLSQRSEYYQLSLRQPVCFKLNEALKKRLSCEGGKQQV